MLARMPSSLRDTCRRIRRARRFRTASFDSFDGLPQIAGADIAVEFGANRHGDRLGEPVYDRLGQPVARLAHQLDVQVAALGLPIAIVGYGRPFEAKLDHAEVG